MFGYIEKNSEELKKMLEFIRDPNTIWTNFGLRSLSQHDHKF